MASLRRPKMRLLIQRPLIHQRSIHWSGLIVHTLPTTFFSLPYSLAALRTPHPAVSNPSTSYLSRTVATTHAFSSSQQGSQPSYSGGTVPHQASHYAPIHPNPSSSPGPHHYMGYTTSYLADYTSAHQSNASAQSSTSVGAPFMPPHPSAASQATSPYVNFSEYSTSVSKHNAYAHIASQRMFHHPPQLSSLRVETYGGSEPRFFNLGNTTNQGAMVDQGVLVDQAGMAGFGAGDRGAHAQRGANVEMEFEEVGVDSLSSSPTTPRSPKGMSPTSDTSYEHCLPGEGQSLHWPRPTIPAPHTGAPVPAPLMEDDGPARRLARRHSANPGGGFGSYGFGSPASAPGMSTGFLDTAKCRDPNERPQIESDVHTERDVYMEDMERIGVRRRNSYPVAPVNRTQEMPWPNDGSSEFSLNSSQMNDYMVEEPRNKESKSISNPFGADAAAAKREMEFACTVSSEKSASGQSNREGRREAIRTDAGKPTHPLRQNEVGEASPMLSFLSSDAASPAHTYPPARTPSSKRPHPHTTTDAIPLGSHDVREANLTRVESFPVDASGPSTLNSPHPLPQFHSGGGTHTQRPAAAHTGAPARTMVRDAPGMHQNSPGTPVEAEPGTPLGIPTEPPGSPTFEVKQGTDQRFLPTTQQMPAQVGSRVGMHAERQSGLHSGEQVACQGELRSPQSSSPVMWMRCPEESKATSVPGWMTSRAVHDPPVHAIYQPHTNPSVALDPTLTVASLAVPSPRHTGEFVMEDKMSYPASSSRVSRSPPASTLLAPSARGRTSSPPPQDHWQSMISMNAPPQGPHSHSQPGVMSQSFSSGSSRQPAQSGTGTGTNASDSISTTSASMYSNSGPTPMAAPLLSMYSQRGSNSPGPTHPGSTAVPQMHMVPTSLLLRREASTSSESSQAESLATYTHGQSALPHSFRHPSPRAQSDLATSDIPAGSSHSHAPGPQTAHLPSYAHASRPLVYAPSQSQRVGLVPDERSPALQPGSLEGPQHNESVMSPSPTGENDIYFDSMNYNTVHPIVLSLYGPMPQESQQKLERLRKAATAPRTVLKWKKQLSSCAKVITRRELVYFFHAPRDYVVRELGVCQTLFKKMCRRCGISSWPYRAIKALVAQMDVIRRQLPKTAHGAPNDPSEYHATLTDMLAQCEASLISVLTSGAPTKQDLEVAAPVFRADDAGKATKKAPTQKAPTAAANSPDHSDNSTNPSKAARTTSDTKPTNLKNNASDSNCSPIPVNPHNYPPSSVSSESNDSPASVPVPGPGLPTPLGSSSLSVESKSSTASATAPEPMLSDAPLLSSAKADTPSPTGPSQSSAGSPSPTSLLAGLPPLAGGISPSSMLLVGSPSMPGETFPSPSALLVSPSPMTGTTPSPPASAGDSRDAESRGSASGDGGGRSDGGLGVP
eukprot:Rmarinus@m.2377